MKIFRRACFAFVLAASAVAPACAKGKADCVPVVREGWIRLVPGGMHLRVVAQPLPEMTMLGFRTMPRRSTRWAASSAKTRRWVRRVTS